MIIFSKLIVVVVCMIFTADLLPRQALIDNSFENLSIFVMKKKSRFVRWKKERRPLSVLPEICSLEIRKLAASRHVIIITSRGTAYRVDRRP